MLALHMHHPLPLFMQRKGEGRTEARDGQGHGLVEKHKLVAVVNLKDSIHFVAINETKAEELEIVLIEAVPVYYFHFCLLKQPKSQVITVIAKIPILRHHLGRMSRSSIISSSLLL